MADEFINTVPNEYHDAVTKAGISDLASLVKNWHDTMSAQGQMIRVPGKDAGTDDVAKFDARLAEKVPGLVRLPAPDDKAGWSQFYQRLGAPEAPTGYKFTPVEGIPAEASASMGKWLGELAHGINLTGEQAGKVYDAIMESMKANQASAAAAAATATAELKTEWGASFDQRVARCQHVLKIFGGEGGAKLAEAELDASGLGDHPHLARILDRIAGAMTEDDLITVDRDGLMETLGELEKKIGEIRGNSKHPFNDVAHPGHKQALVEMESLYTKRQALRGQAA